MKDKLLAWLFKGYAKNLRRQSKLELDAYKASVDVKDIVRARLKGLRPGNPDEDRLQNKLARMETPERLEFLSKAHDMVQNWAFREVCRYIIEEAEHKAVLYATTMEEVNFQRATVNGVQLIEEELKGLSTMYIEEKKLNRGMTEAERHGVI